jgi:hypothetical protein
MAESIGLSMADSGIKDLLLGGAKDTLGASIFGQEGTQGGGLAGVIASAFGSAATATGLSAALSKAWSGIEGIVSSVLGNAFKGIASIINSIFGTALGVAAKGAAGLGGAAVSAAATTTATTAETALATALTAAAIPMGALATAETANSLASTALVPVMTVGSIAMTDLTAALLVAAPAMTDLATAMEIQSSIQVAGAIFEAGGIASAASGMITSGSSSGIPILAHPNEMILPSPISQGLQDIFLNGRLPSAAVGMVAGNKSSGLPAPISEGLLKIIGGGGTGGGFEQRGVLPTATELALPELVSKTVENYFSGGSGSASTGIPSAASDIISKTVENYFPSGSAKASTAIPSAAGGMVMGSDFGFGARGVAIHPDEIVLPAPLSEGFQNIIAQQGGSQGGGDDRAIHVHIHSPDPRGFKNMLTEHSGHLEQLMTRALRNAL